jgi:hypothetical protein
MTASVTASMGMDVRDRQLSARADPSDEAAEASSALMFAEIVRAGLQINDI